MSPCSASRASSRLCLTSSAATPPPGLPSSPPSILSSSCPAPGPATPPLTWTWHGGGFWSAMPSGRIACRQPAVSSSSESSAATSSPLPPLSSARSSTAAPPTSTPSSSPPLPASTPAAASSDSRGTSESPATRWRWDRPRATSRQRSSLRPLPPGKGRGSSSRTSTSPPAGCCSWRRRCTASTPCPGSASSSPWSSPRRSRRASCSALESSCTSRRWGSEPACCAP
mmetsp:Transcript_14446/g.49353  ORF Transcript_14446/g.49353 Transcript_14446/m.49353 type:complete len:227 (+) Transcript_14446:2789-3469(+)